jgi:hypothetical protein
MNPSRRIIRQTPARNLEFGRRGIVFTNPKPSRYSGRAGAERVPVALNAVPKWAVCVPGKTRRDNWPFRKALRSGLKGQRNGIAGGRCPERRGNRHRYLPCRMSARAVTARATRPESRSPQTAECQKPFLKLTPKFVRNDPCTPKIAFVSGANNERACKPRRFQRG